MRLFAAVAPPPEARAEITELLAPQHQELRFGSPEQWHITTAFYGEVAESLLPPLVERLGRAAARTPALTLRLHGAGTFPRQANRARVLWIGVAGDVAVLSRLADRCAAAGRRSGVAMEDRPFRPHLTVARARRDPVDLRDTIAGLSAYDGVPWPATSLRLVHSTLGAHVEHRTVQEWPLPRPGDPAK